MKLLVELFIQVLLKILKIKLKKKQKFFEKTEPNQKFPLQDSLTLLIKKKTLNYKLSENSEKGLKMWEDFILNESKSNFTKILSSIDNQEEFAKLSRNIIKDLGYGDQLGEDPNMTIMQKMIIKMMKVIVVKILMKMIMMNNNFPMRLKN